MYLYPFDWNEETNRPFNLLNQDFINPSLDDEGSLPTSLTSSELDDLIDEDIIKPLRVQDYLLPSGANLRQIKTKVDVIASLVTRFDLFAGLARFDRVVDTTVPEEWHLITSHDCLYIQGSDDAFDDIHLNPGYTNLIFDKTTWDPSALSLSSATFLNIGCQVGTTAYIGGLPYKFNKPVEALGIVATNLDILSGWDIWGSNDNQVWTNLSKSSLNSGGWENGEYYYASFRGSGINCRIVKLEEQEKFQYFKLTINDSQATDIYKIFTLNLTGEFGVSIDGTNFEYLKGDVYRGGQSGGSSTIDQEEIGALCGSIGTYYDGPSNNPTIDDNLSNVRGLSIDNANNVLLVCDAHICACKLFDLDTDDCVAYFTPVTPNPTEKFFYQAYVHGGYYWMAVADILNPNTQVIQKRNSTSPYALVDTFMTTTNVDFESMAFAVDDDYMYVNMKHLGSGMNILQKIDLDTKVVIDEVSRLFTSNTPVFFTASSFEQDYNYLYGLDNDTALHALRKLTKLRKSDFGVELTTTGWTEGTTSYSFNDATDPTFAGMDQNYIYLTVFVSHPLLIDGTKDILKLRKTDFSFVDRVAGIPPAVSWDINWPPWGARYAVCNETFLYVKNILTNPNPFINKYYKNTVFSRDENSIVFPIENTDNFKFFSNVRYKLDPFSNSKLAYYDLLNLFLFNDPKKLTTHKIAQEYYQPADYAPNNCATTDLQYGSEAASLGTWISVSLGQQWIINADTDFIYQGDYSIALVNGGVINYSEVTLQSQISAGSTIILNIQGFASDYSGILTIKNKADNQILLANQQLFVDTWTNLNSQAVLTSNCEVLSIQIDPLNPVTVTDYAPNNSCTTVAAYGTEEQTVNGWDMGVVDTNIYHGGSCSLRLSTISGNLSPVMSLSQILSAGSEISISIWVYILTGTTGSVRILNNSGEVLIDSVPFNAGWMHLTTTRTVLTDTYEIVVEFRGTSGAATYRIDDCYCIIFNNNQRTYYLDCCSFVTNTLIKVKESVEKKPYTIDDGKIGEIGNSDELQSSLDIGTGADEVRPQSYQLFNLKTYRDAIFSNWSEIDGAATSFYLSDLSSRINEVKFILNSNKNGIGSVSNTSIVIANGGSVFVSEVSVGGLSMAGDYSIDYNTGKVTTWLPKSSIPSNCTIAFSYAKEGTHALQYTTPQPFLWKTFGDPANYNLSSMAVTGPLFWFEYYLRSNLSLFSTRVVRGSELMIYLNAVSQDTNIPVDYRNHVIINFVTIMNAYEVDKTDGLNIKESAGSLSVDGLFVKNLTGVKNVDILSNKLPFNRLEADMIAIKGYSSFLEADLASMKQYISQVNVDYLPTLIQLLRLNVDTIPIATLKSDMEVALGYAYDRLAGTKDLAVRGRKKGTT